MCILHACCAAQLFALHVAETTLLIESPPLTLEPLTNSCRPSDAIWCYLILSDAIWCYLNAICCCVRRYFSSVFPSQVQEIVVSISHKTVYRRCNSATVRARVETIWGWGHHLAIQRYRSHWRELRCGVFSWRYVGTFVIARQVLLEDCCLKRRGTNAPRVSALTVIRDWPIWLTSLWWNNLLFSLAEMIDQSDWQVYGEINYCFL